MKTPREILFERHREAGPRLDAIRRKALAALQTEVSAEKLELDREAEGFECRMEWGIVRSARWVPAAVSKMWLELIWPARRAWTGMAAVWLGVVATNLEMKATSPAAPAVGSTHSRELVQAVEEQRRLLAELLTPAEPPPVRIPRPSPPPRSEAGVLFKGC